MGWRKILSHSTGGDIALGNWRAHYNDSEDSIDLEHPSDGIPYVKTDTAFSGVTVEMNMDGGKLKINTYPGWDENTARDENTVLDDTTAWDENTSASVLFDYLFSTTAITMVYEGETSWVSSPTDLTTVGKYHSSKLEWVNDALPAGAAIHFYASLYRNGAWGDYAEIPASGGVIPVLPVSGTDLRGMQVRYKVKMVPSSDQLSSPAISQVKTTINSRKHFRVLLDGSYKESQHIADSITGATIETLI
ncbi:MAG: hypothetical protein PHE82_01295 [Syntrophomonadaceae bacterium]|nr:hypothetical protein [Syntrophomonadaceae bacterium]